MRRVVVNSVGKVMRTMDDVDAIPGSPIQLTIDEDLQAGRRNGFRRTNQVRSSRWTREPAKVLAMVSRPTFDPNDFAVRIPAARMGRA